MEDCSTNVGTENFSVVLQESCQYTPIIIDGSIITDFSYTVRTGQDVRNIDEALITVVSSCPALEIGFTNQDGTSLESAVFTYDGSLNDFTTETTDDSYATVYNLRLTVNYLGITGNDATFDFTVTVISPCVDTPITTSSLLIPAYSKYAIGATILTKTIDDSLITSDTDCPTLEFEMTNSGSALVNPQNFDPSTKQFDVYTTDISFQNVLFNNVLTVRYTGITGNDYVENFDVFIIVICDSTLTIESSMITTSPIEYDVFDP